MKKDTFKGLSLSIVIGLIAFFISIYTPSYLGSIVLALVFGIIVKNTFRPNKSFQSGIDFTGGKFLELSIVFLAFQINYKSIADLGLNYFLILFLTIIAVLLLTIFLSKLFNFGDSTGLLIGFGTAICGSTAIGALAPMVAKQKNEIATSMAVVNILGSIAMLTFPLLLMQTNFTEGQSGFFIGGSLQAVGNVVGAGYAISDEIGDLSLTFKLARVALLTPSLLFFALLINRKSSAKKEVKLNIPWYLILFVVISVFSTFVSINEEFLEITKITGKLLMIVAMAAIGLNVGLKQFIQSGGKSLVFGSTIFIAQLILLYTLYLILF